MMEPPPHSDTRQRCGQGQLTYIRRNLLENELATVAVNVCKSQVWKPISVHIADVVSPQVPLSGLPSR